MFKSKKASNPELIVYTIFLTCEYAKSWIHWLYTFLGNYTDQYISIAYVFHSIQKHKVMVTCL